jgi:hypothetical protein
MRQVEQQVRHPGGSPGFSQEPVEKRGDLGADAGKGPGGSKKRVEDRGSQGHRSG